MADQRIVGPYGDIVQVVTPTLDNVAKQLYVAQQQRQLRQQQENQALDQMLQKDFTNIRSVDTPDVVNSYNNYKQLKKNLLFNKDLQRDPMLYNQAQQAANQAFADMNRHINQSKEIKEMTKTMTTDRFKNPDAYADDYGQRVMMLNNTPVSALANAPDLVNWDMYRYQGSNTNFNDIVSKIYDKKNKIVGKEEALDKQGIQFRSPVYEYGTPPAQVYEGLVNALDHKTERDAAYKWKQVTPEVIQNIERDYNAIPQSKWEQMGLSGPQKIDLRGGSDAEKYMRLLAMQNAINTAPRLVNYENRTSEKAKMDLQYERQLKLQAIKHANAKELVALRKDAQKDPDTNDTWVENYLEKIISEAKADPKRAHDIYNGKEYNGRVHEIPQDSVIEKAFTRGAGKDARTPDKLYATDDGRIFPVFYKYGDDGKGNSVLLKNKAGHPLIDEDYGGPLSMDQAKLALGYRGQTKKQLDKTMSGSSSKPKTVKQNGHIYTLNESTGEYE